MRIAPDARKHGIDDEDILHAVRNRMFHAIGNHDLAMSWGQPAMQRCWRSAFLLQTAMTGRDHADRARDKFLP